MAIRIRSRRGWTSVPLTAQTQRLGKHSTPCVHHTASSYGINSKSSVKDEQAVLRKIEAQHRSQGWNNIAYSQLIFPSGRIYTGRGWNRIPAGAIGFNSGNWHPCLVGNFETQKPTPAALRSLRSLTRRFRIRTGSKRKAVGHYQVNPTACPGKNLKPHVRRLP
jgi:hypothetical protein